MSCNEFLAVAASARAFVCKFGLNKGLTGDRTLLVARRQPGHPTTSTVWFEVWPSPYIIQQNEQEQTLLQGADKQAELGSYRVQGLDKFIYPMSSLLFTGNQYRIDGVLQWNANAATSAELQNLPEINQTLADAIVAERGNALFVDADDLFTRVPIEDPSLQGILSPRLIFSLSDPVSKPYGGFFCDRVEGTHLEEDSLTWSFSLREAKRP